LWGVKMQEDDQRSRPGCRVGANYSCVVKRNEPQQLFGAVTVWATIQDQTLPICGVSLKCQVEAAELSPATRYETRVWEDSQALLFCPEKIRVVLMNYYFGRAARRSWASGSPGSHNNPIPAADQPTEVGWASNPITGVLRGLFN